MRCPSYPAAFPNVISRSIATTVLTAIASFAIPVVSANASVAAHFGGVETTVSGCSSECFGVAVDPSGNVYIADTYNNRVLKETLSATGYAQSVIATGLNKPYGVAVDTNGNVYVADSYNFQVVKETLAAGIYTPSVIASGLASTPFNVAVDALGNVYVAGGNSGTSNAPFVYKLTPSGSAYTKSAVADASSGMQTPWELAVDSNGNVYVTDSQGSAVYKETPSGGSYVQSTVATGLNFPTGVAVDSNGNVYVANANSDQILFESPASAGGYTQTVYATGSLSFPYELAADSKGNLYIANSQAFNVLKETPGAVDFGSVNVGAHSSAVSLNFAFDSAGAIGTPAVVTQGAANLDFADAGTGSCTSNGTSLSYSAGQTCTLNVVFQPKIAGVLSGAAVLTDHSGNQIAVAYLHGTGVAPQVDFLPGTQSSLPSTGLQDPAGMAVDGSGNLYFFDGGQVLRKETYVNGVYTLSTLFSNLSNSGEVAVDGAGNIFIAEGSGGCSCIKRESPNGGGFSESIVMSGFAGPSGLAVDSAGNLYVVDNPADKAYRLSPSTTGYTATTIGTNLPYPFAVAVDGAGVLYMANTTDGQLTVETPTSTGYTQSTVTLPDTVVTEIAADIHGNLYTIDRTANTASKWTYSSGTWTRSSLGANLSSPLGIAPDRYGNVFIADTDHKQVVKIDFADPPAVSFASTAYQATSADSPETVTLQNIGNAALDIPPPTSGENPSISNSFTLGDGGSACPIVGASSASGSLSAGASCELSISFTPQAIGTISGSLVLTDNALNASPSQQTISLSGVATQATPIISWATAAPITYGTALGSAQLDATASVPGTFTYSPAAGTILTGGLQTLKVTFTPIDLTDYTSATASVALTVNPAAPTITWATPAAISYGAALSATQLDATASVSGTFTYSPAAGTVLGVGSQTLTTTFTPKDSINYATATDSVTLTVNKATPAIALTSSSNPADVSQAVTFTATVTAPAGAPTGSVAFFNGTTQLGSGTVAAGSATYTTSSLAAGSYNITAVYSGDANFVSVTSSVLTQSVAAFALGSASGGTTSSTVSPGGTATYSLDVTPPGNSAVTFTVTGTPTGATSTFTPSTVAAGAPTTAVQLSVTVPSQSALAVPAGSRRPLQMPIALGFVLLSLPFVGRLRKGHRFLRILLLCFAGAASLAVLNGCGGGNSGGAGESQPQTYNLTVTAAAGSQTQSFNLTLTVQ